MHAHDTDTVSTFVLDKKRKGIVQFHEKFKMSKTHFDVIELNKELNQIVVIENTELSHE